jgi:4-amino-4-deoxy-L-arabinose transferase-like glycosyltransferase
MLLVLAVMTKGPVAAALVVLFGLAMSANGTTRPIVTRLRWAAGLIFVAVAASPWFIWLWIVFGDDFLNHYVLAGNIYYFTSPPSYSSRNSGWLFYLRVFAGAFFPWSLLTIARGADALRLRRQKSRIPVEEQALWIWIAVVVGFFTAARFKLDYYIFPTAPAACMLAAYGVLAAATRTSLMRWAFLVTGFVLAVAGAVGSVALFRINLGLGPPALFLPVALAAGGTTAVAFAWRHRPLPHSVAAVTATLLCAYASVAMFGFPVLERSRPTPPLGRWIARHAPLDVPVGVYRLSDWLGTARYYSQRPVVRLDTEDALRGFLTRWPDAFVILPQGQCDQLGASGVDLEPVVGLPGIVGRTGKYVRSQIWDRIVVATHRSAAARLDLSDTDPVLLEAGALPRP